MRKTKIDTVDTFSKCVNACYFDFRKSRFEHTFHTDNYWLIKFERLSIILFIPQTFSLFCSLLEDPTILNPAATDTPLTSVLQDGCPTSNSSQVSLLIYGDLFQIITNLSN